MSNPEQQSGKFSSPLLLVISVAVFFPLLHSIVKLIADEETQDKIIEEINIYQEQKKSFGHDIAIR